MAVREFKMGEGCRVDASGIDMRCRGGRRRIPWPRRGVCLWIPT